MLHLLHCLSQFQVVQIDPPVQLVLEDTEDKSAPSRYRELDLRDVNDIMATLRAGFQEGCPQAALPSDACPDVGSVDRGPF